MSYRGKDLDLRTGEPARATGSRSNSRPSQVQAKGSEFDIQAVLYVEDAVLACCNHAYDLALAYRAPEVRLEHLINAMTRTDAAVAVMAAQGIDITSLRHDTATLIAAEAPMNYAAQRPTPRRSQDLADALHTAATAAEMRRGPISVNDLLQTLLGMKREQSGLLMLKRNAPGMLQRDSNEAPRTEQLPPLLDGLHQLDSRYTPPETRGNEPTREWLTMPPAPAYYQGPYAGTLGQPKAQQAYYATEPAQLPPGGGGLADVVQNSRLDQLERIIRDLSGGLINQAGRGGEYGAAAAASVDRLAGFERNVEAKFNDIARVWSVLGDRLQALEQAVVARRSEPNMPMGLVDKLHHLDGLGQVLASIGDRLAGLERQVAAKSAAGLAVNLQPMVDRLDAIERSLVARASVPALNLTPVLERLTSIDARVTEVSRGDSTGSAAEWGDRLQAIEAAVAAQSSEITTFSISINASVKELSDKFGQAVVAQKTGAERIQSVIGERFQGFTAAFEHQRSDATQTMTTVCDKLNGLDKLMQSFGQRTLDLHAAHGKDLIELHNAFVKLNTNQQTLAASMDEWRLDNGTEFGTIATRLESIERSSERPVQMLETLQQTVLALQKASLKREEQKSRFRHWLMGTDDWYGASWEQPEAKASVHVSGSNGATAVKDTTSSKLGLAPNPYNSTKA